MKDTIIKAFEESAQIKVKFVRENADKIVEVVQVIAQAFREGRKVILFGNGGSAMDASHIAAEFVNRFVIERPPLPALALTTDSSALTSIANDYKFDDVFAKQVQALGQPGDVAFAISTSGTSRNVVRAVTVCRKLRIYTVAFTGGGGGKLATMVDHLLDVSATRETARIQETHILAGHVVCQLVDERLHGAQ